MNSSFAFGLKRVTKKRPPQTKMAPSEASEPYSVTSKSFTSVRAMKPKNSRIKTMMRVSRRRPHFLKRKVPIPPSKKKGPQTPRPLAAPGIIRKEILNAPTAIKITEMIRINIFMNTLYPI